MSAALSLAAVTFIVDRHLLVAATAPERARARPVRRRSPSSTGLPAMLRRFAAGFRLTRPTVRTFDRRALVHQVEDDSSHVAVRLRPTLEHDLVLDRLEPESTAPTRSRTVCRAPAWWRLLHLSRRRIDTAIGAVDGDVQGYRRASRDLGIGCECDVVGEQQPVTLASLAGKAGPERPPAKVLAEAFVNCRYQSRY